MFVKGVVIFTIILLVKGEGKTTSTTTTTSTSTTTESPTTAPTSPPTTITPTPVPEPPRQFPGNIGNWNITENNVSCIKFVGAIQISVPYKLEQSNSTGNATINVPGNAKTDGNCSIVNNKITLALVWNSNTTDDDGNFANNVLNFVFWKNSSAVVIAADKIPSGSYALQDINGLIHKYGPLFPDAADNDTVEIHVSNKTAFMTQLSHSYSCSSTEALVGEIGTIKIANLQVEAFRNTTSPTFSPPSVCPADDVTDIVPIAVGASLAALVVIVLIAYLIGRRRSRSRGYQSV